MSGQSTNIARNNLLGTIDSWGPLFRVSLDLKIHSTSPGIWTTVLAFKANGGESNAGQYGDRAPMIAYKNSTIRFVNSVNGNAGHGNVEKIELGKWYHIEIEQKMNNGKVITDCNCIDIRRNSLNYQKVYYSVKIDGREIFNIVNSDARLFRNVKVFVNDKFHPPTDATYKNLFWENLGKISFSSLSFVKFCYFCYISRVGRTNKPIVQTQNYQVNERKDQSIELCNNLQQVGLVCSEEGQQLDTEDRGGVWGEVSPQEGGVRSFPP